MNVHAFDLAVLQDRSLPIPLFHRDFFSMSSSSTQQHGFQFILSQEPDGTGGISGGASVSSALGMGISPDKSCSGSPRARLTSRTLE